VGNTTYKEEALRVLRNLLPHVGEAWRPYPDETYDFWEAGLNYADELFGQYEGLGSQVEEADTLDLSSAVSDLLEALEELRGLAAELAEEQSRLESGEVGEDDVENQDNMTDFELKLEEVKEELAKFD
jgi:hypothetical protein